MLPKHFYFVELFLINWRISVVTDRENHGLENQQIFRDLIPDPKERISSEIEMNKTLH